MSLIEARERRPRGRVTPRFREGVGRTVEHALQNRLEKHGFVPIVEEKSVALTARVDTQRALWALKGFDHLFPPRTDSDEGAEDSPRIDDLLDVVFKRPHREDTRLEALAHRLMGVPQRRKLLNETITNTASPDEKIAAEARRRLGLVMDIVDDKLEKPNPDGHKAVILTQTAYLLGDEGEKRPEVKSKTFRQIEKLGVDLASGSMPYLGAAVVYSELMATGRFADIEIIDFRDSQAIEEMIERGDREFAFVSGATTYDNGLVDSLNQKLSSAGLTVVNGGVAAGIARDPERYLKNGGSVYVGDFEGAADKLVDELESNTDPRVFVRQGNARRLLKLDRQETPHTILVGLSERALLHEAYSPERELDGERLANRLLALEMMRPTVSLGEQQYELSPFFKFHETSTSYGCPETCSFCATVPLQGVDMRKRSVASLRQEWEAVESKVVAIVDQNFIANGRDYTTEVLKLGEATGKRLAFEGELLYFRTAPEQDNPALPAPQNYFFDGTAGDQERERLLRTVPVAIAVGLEQPVKVRGTIKDGGKDPNQFAEAQRRLNDLGIMTFGTMVVGMPPQLWEHGQESDRNIIPWSNMNPDKWKEMVDTWVKWVEGLQVPGPVIFSFTPIEGTPAFDRLEKEDVLFQRSSDQQHEVSGIDASSAVRDIRREVYSWRSAAKRIRGTNMSAKRKFLMAFYNAVASRAFRTGML